MRIHWFSITIFSSFEHGLDMWQKFFQLELGDLVSTARAGRGFRSIMVGLAESKLYYDPVPQSSIEKDFYHLEFTGSACDAVIPTHFQDLVMCLQADNIPFHVTRLDLAFDDVPFTPQEFFDHVCDPEQIVTRAKRETFRIDKSPFQLREDGQEGCDTCYIGSRSSERFLRVYNQRGFTRLESQYSGHRATAISLDMFSYHYRDWDFVARQHLLDYVNFPSWAIWLGFIKSAKKADLIITPARKVSLSKIHAWLDHQVSVALSVFFDVHGWETAQEILDNMLFEAQNRDRERYKSVLSLKPPFQRVARIPEIHGLINGYEFPLPECVA